MDVFNKVYWRLWIAITHLGYVRLQSLCRSSWTGYCKKQRLAARFLQKFFDDRLWGATFGCRVSSLTARNIWLRCSSQKLCWSHCPEEGACHQDTLRLFIDLLHQWC
jgi:hypothetical protein